MSVCRGRVKVVGEGINNIIGQILNWHQGQRERNLEIVVGEREKDRGSKKKR